MADPTNANSQNVTGNADVGGASQAANLANVLGQVAAAMAGVTNSMNEITAKLNALENTVESRIKQTSANDDSNFETSVTGVHDPYEDVRRSSIVTHRLSVSMAENADAMMKEYLKYTAGVWARSLDHFCSVNPEVPPRANKA